MKAVDTNVVLRLIVADDPVQESAARALVAEAPVLVPLTVTLECEWVLRSYYKHTPIQIADELDAMTDLHNIVFEHVAGVRWALGRLAAGADFADMIHIVEAADAGASSFATFDTGIRDYASAGAPIPAFDIA